MVHYHQQALQFIMYVDIFEVFCITVAITNPVCKQMYDISPVQISHTKALKSFYFRSFYFQLGQGL